MPPPREAHVPPTSATCEHPVTEQCVPPPREAHCPPSSATFEHPATEPRFQPPREPHVPPLSATYEYLAREQYSDAGCSLALPIYPLITSFVYISSNYLKNIPFLFSI